MPSTADMLSVLIATANRAAALRETLQSLAECGPPACPWQVVIVENGPKSGVEEIVTSMSSKLPLQYLYHPRLNKSNALNYACERLPNGLILFTDDDVLFDRGFLRAYGDVQRRATPGFFWGGISRSVFAGPEPVAWLRPYLPISIVEVSMVDGNGALKERFLGYNWAARAEDLRRTRGFDPRFGPGSHPRAVGQETDMQLKLLELGCVPRFVPDAIVFHKVRRENVTEEDALLRIGWRGVRDGIINAAEGLSLPIMAWRALVRLAAWPAKRVLGRARPSIFRTKCEFYYALGYLRGRASNGVAAIRGANMPRPTRDRAARFGAPAKT